MSKAGPPQPHSSHVFTKTEGPVCLSVRTPTTWLRIFLDAVSNSRCFKGGAWGFPGSRPGLEAANILLKMNDAKGQRSGCGSLHFPMGHPHPFLFPTVPPGIARKCTLSSFWISSFSSHPRLRLPSHHLRRACFVLFESRNPRASPCPPACPFPLHPYLPIYLFIFKNLSIIRGFLKRGK